MKCYNHPKQDAVAQCIDCGKGLCQECTVRWSIPICDTCQNNRINADLAFLNRELILYLGLAITGIVFGLLMYSSTSNALGVGRLELVITYGLGFPIYVAGWKWLNHITDHFTLLATPGVWIIYLFIKLLISAFVGMIALPYRLFIIHKRKSELRSLFS